VPFHGVQDYDWPFVGGRLVGTLADFNLAASDDFDVVVFADALQALAPANAAAFGRLARQRVYGVLVGGRRVAAAASLRLQAQFGPVLYSVPDPRGDAAPVCVRWLPPPLTEPPGNAAALLRKRTAYWGNGRRNDLVADVARGFAESDRGKLWASGLLLGQNDDVPAVVGGTSVTAVVESTDHARELLRRLPAWRLFAATTADAPAPPADPFAWRPLHRAVITLAAAEGVGDLHTDVVIWAGMEYPPGLPGFPPRSTENGQTVTLVDFADDFDAAARAAVARRAREYAARGWEMVGTPPWARDRG
jgi:hypothetical protein